MKSFAASVLVFSAMTLPAFAAETVTLTDVHMCCDSCVKGATAAIAPVKGATAVSDKTAGTVVLSAPDKATVQAAVNALTAAGYFGKSSDATITVDAPTNAPEGKVQTLEVSGVHLCCNACVTAVKGVIAKVDGIKADTVKPKASVFTLTGDFNAKTLFEELQKAGLTGKVAAPK